MRALRALQGALMELYRIDVPYDVHDFVRPLDPRDPDAPRGEVVLVADDAAGDALSVAVCLDERVLAALGGAGPSRFDAWCQALEGVSHFTLLAWRAERERPVSQLEMEFQADVDKFAVGVLQRAVGKTPGEARRASGLLRRALFDRARFHDPPDTPRGARYRAAHRLAARYAASLERRHLRQARIQGMVEELRDFYRSSTATRFAMAAR